MVGIRPTVCPAAVLRLRGRPPHRAADEERADARQILRGLDGRTHGLDQGGERAEILADQTDDEVVVGLVEAVASQADIRGETGFAEPPADDAVLLEYLLLLRARQAREGAGAAQGIPDRPGGRRVEDHAARAVQEPVFQARFVAEGVGASQHGELGLEPEALEGTRLEDGAELRHEVGGINGHGEHGHAGRVIGFLVEHGVEPGVGQDAGEGGRVPAAGEGGQLHEEAAVEFERLFGRRYDVVEGYRLEDADDVLVMTNAYASKGKVAVDQAREEGRKVGLLRLRMIRPWPADAIRQALRGRRSVAVLDQNLSPGQGGILFQEIGACLYHEPVRPRALCSFIGGLGGKNISEGEFRAIFEQMVEAGVRGKGIGPVLLYTEAEHREMEQLQFLAHELKTGR